MGSDVGSQFSQNSSPSQARPSTPRKRQASPSFSTPTRKLARGNSGQLPRNIFNTPEDRRKRLQDIEDALAAKSGARNNPVQHDFPVTPTKGPQAPPMLLSPAKGKEREQFFGSQESGASEDVFGPATQNSMSTPHAGPSRGGLGLRQTPSASSSRIFSGTQMPELSPEEITDMLEKLSGIPNQIRKRQALADKREESAKKRIAELEEDNAELEIRVQSLEAEKESLLARIRTLESGESP
ncbi:hypothetical protein HDZ31DRAFT_60170 [Schizophyllum fasciatum]